jgi:hypothetical protein
MQGGSVVVVVDVVDVVTIVVVTIVVVVVVVVVVGGAVVGTTTAIQSAIDGKVVEKRPSTDLFRASQSSLGFGPQAP